MAPLQSESLIPLNSGAYAARGYIADAQVCENLYPEMNPQDAEPTVAVTHYPKPGARPLAVAPVPGAGRGVFALSNGALISVVGANVYSVSSKWVHTYLGSIAANTTPVSIKDNGTTAMLVDNSANGYTIAMSNNAFGPIVDPTGTFVGATRVDFVDTYMAFNIPGTNGWGVSNPNSITFNILQQANKDSQPDPIVTLAFNDRQAWLLGTRSSEIWFNAGSTPFPYQEWPNIFVPYGCAATYSLAQADVDLFWLSRNPQGQAIAVKTKGLSVEEISTMALNWEWANYTTVADCITSAYQHAGHTFVAFHFPSANKTWVYDLATRQWHRRYSINQNGVQNRDNATFYASVGPDGGFAATIVGQDWQTGQLYALDPTYFLDNATPIVCRRTFPHQVSDMQQMTMTSFIADFEPGEMPNVANLVAGSQYFLQMRVSKDGGNTWTNYRQKGLVTSGNYRKLFRWRNLGQARDWVFDLQWSYPGPSALQGAYIPGVIKHGA